MNEYLAMFTEQPLFFSEREAHVIDHGKRYLITVKADNIYDAYYRAVELVKEKTKELVHLDYCRLKCDVLRDSARLRW